MVICIQSIAYFTHVGTFNFYLMSETSEHQQTNDVLAGSETTGKTEAPCASVCRLEGGSESGTGGGLDDISVDAGRTAFWKLFKTLNPSGQLRLKTSDVQRLAVMDWFEWDWRLGVTF
ncbi:uncharacterized protein [Musca autumnalis]|uniref:uncharacterized protein n=1 Tax=Musca autumnalis TaxID=221902 RepID=UPI003CF89345